MKGIDKRQTTSQPDAHLHVCGTHFSFLTPV